MALSPNKGYLLQPPGANRGTWGNAANDGVFSIIDDNLGGRLTKSGVASGTVTITDTEAENVFHLITGALTGNVDYVLPNRGSFYFIKNATSAGPYTVTVKPLGGTGVTLPAGDYTAIGVNPDDGTAFFVGGSPTPPSPSLDALQFDADSLFAYSIFEDLSQIIFIQPVYGQSGAQGVSSDSSSVALTTSAAYPGFVLAPYITTGVDANKPMRSPGQVSNAFVEQTFAGFTDLYEYVTTVSGPRQSETPNSAMLNRFVQKVFAARGEKPVVVLNNGAQGGQGSRNLKRGSDAYRNFLYNHKQIADMIRALGKTPVTLPILYEEGPADTTGAQIIDRLQYAQFTAQIQQDLENDFKAICNQTIAIPMILSQSPSFRSTQADNAYYMEIYQGNVPSCGEELLTSLNPKIIMGGATYQYARFPNPGLHLTSPGYRQLGCDWGDQTGEIFLEGGLPGLRWNPDETMWKDCQTLRLFYRKPSKYVPSGTATLSIADGKATVTAIGAGTEVTSSQRITGGAVAADTFILSPTDAATIGALGDYDLIEESSQTVGSTAVTLDPAVGPPNYYASFGCIDETGTYIGLTDIEVSKGFNAVTTQDLFSGNTVEFDSVTQYRPTTGIFALIVDLRFKQRPSSPLAISYAAQVPQFNSVTIPDGATITPGSGGTDGTFNLIFSGGTFIEAAAGTFTVAGGGLTSVTISINGTSGIAGGLYTDQDTLPTMSFANSAGLTGASIEYEFTGTSGQSPTRGNRGCVRTMLPRAYTSAGEPIFDWAIHQFQIVPAPPQPQPNQIYNGTGLVHTEPFVALTDGQEGHNGWHAVVQGSPAATITPDTFINGNGEPFIRLTTNAAAPGKRAGYYQVKSAADTESYHNIHMALGGRLSRSDATESANNNILLGSAAWIGTVDATPFIFNDTNSTVFAPSANVTGTIPAAPSTTMTITAVSAGKITAGQSVTGAVNGTVVVRQLTQTGGDPPGFRGTYEVNLTQGAGATVTKCESFYAADVNIVHLGALQTEVLPSGVKTDALNVQIDVPSTANNIVNYTITRDGLPTGEYFDFALKWEPGNAISGFSFETQEQADAVAGVTRFALVESVSALRTGDYTNSPNLWLMGYYGSGTGGGGALYLDRTDPVSDDSIAAFEDAVGNCFRRQLVTGDVREAGAYCDVALFVSTGTCTAASATITTGSYQAPASAVGLPIVLPTSGASPFYPQNSVTITAAGSGYVVGETLTATGGTFSSAFVLTVSSVDGGGGVTGVRWANTAAYGSYTVIPSNPVSTTASAAGTGCTVTVAWTGAPLVTTIASVGVNTITLNSAPSVTQNTIPVWCFGHDDATAVQAMIAYQMANAGSRIYIPNVCGVASRIDMPQGAASGEKPNNNPLIVGDGPGASALIALGSMTNLLRRNTPFSNGGGIKDLTLDGMGLTASAVLTVTTGSNALFSNLSVQNATGSGKSCIVDNGSNQPQWRNIRVRMDPVFSGAVVPDYNFDAASEAGNYSVIDAVNARLANVKVRGGNAKCSHIHAFSAGGVAPPDIGILISNDCEAAIFQVDGAITADIDITANGVVLCGAHLDNGNGLIPIGIGVRLASNVKNCTITGVKTGVSSAWPSGSVISQTGTAHPTTQVFGNAGASYVRVNTQAAFPQGRLTLSATNPVMAADVTGATTVYYLPYTGNLLPTFYAATAASIGSFISYRTLTSSGISLALRSGGSGQVAGSIYDLFACVNNSSTLLLATGPAWSSATSRGTGAGTTELVREANSGLWINAVAMTVRYGAALGDTLSVGVNQAVYLGSMYATANGQTAMMFAPNAAAGGNNCFLGLYNAYNKLPHLSTSRDSAAQYSYDTNTWRSANASASNRVSWLDGLADVFVRAQVSTMIDATGANALIGINVDSTIATPGVISASQNADPVTVQASLNSVPLLGFHYVQAMENGGGGTALWSNGSGYQSLSWQGVM